MDSTDMMRQWARTIATDVTESGHFVTIELWHGSADAQAQKLDTVRIRVGDRALEPDEVVAHLLRVARADADSHSLSGGGLVQRYALLAYRAGAENPESTWPFVIRGADPPRSVADSMGPSEPPSDRGAMAQLMRLVDTFARMQTATYEVTHGMLARQLAESERRREGAEARALDTATLHQRLMDRTHERALEAARVEASIARQQQLWTLVSSYAPVVFGGLPGADRTAVLGRATLDFARSMDAAEANAISSVLSPERRAALARVLELAATSDSPPTPPNSTSGGGS